MDQPLAKVPKQSVKINALNMMNITVTKSFVEILNELGEVIFQPCRNTPLRTVLLQVVFRILVTASCSKTSFASTRPRTAW